MRLGLVCPFLTLVHDSAFSCQTCRRRGVSHTLLGDSLQHPNHQVSSWRLHHPQRKKCFLAHVLGNRVQEHEADGLSLAPLGMGKAPALPRHPLCPVGCPERFFLCTGTGPLTDDSGSRLCAGLWKDPGPHARHQPRASVPTSARCPTTGRRPAVPSDHGGQAPSPRSAAREPLLCHCPRLVGDPCVGSPVIFSCSDSRCGHLGRPVVSAACPVS